MTQPGIKPQSPGPLANTLLIKTIDIGMMVRVFANDLGDLGSIPGRVIPKTQKWYLMPPFSLKSCKEKFNDCKLKIKREELIIDILDFIRKWTFSS